MGKQIRREKRNDSKISRYIASVFSKPLETAGQKLWSEVLQRYSESFGSPILSTVQRKFSRFKGIKYLPAVSLEKRSRNKGLDLQCEKQKGGKT